MEPEALARKYIDLQLEECGWQVQNRDELNIYASKGVAVREFAMPGVGEADYLLYSDGKAIGVVEANLKRAARLRQAILKRAFEGKLVPRDPTDEPASELLAREATGAGEYECAAAFPVPRHEHLIGVQPLRWLSELCPLLALI